jgi:hypothetical protein
MDNSLRTDSLTSERTPAIQGIAHTYAFGEATHECMDGKNWSVTIPGKRWRLPANDHRRLIHRNGLINVTYFPSLADAETYIIKARGMAKKILDWPTESK